MSPSRPGILPIHLLQATSQFFMEESRKRSATLVSPVLGPSGPPLGPSKSAPRRQRIFDDVFHIFALRVACEELFDAYEIPSASQSACTNELFTSTCAAGLLFLMGMLFPKQLFGLRVLEPRLSAATSELCQVTVSPWSRGHRGRAPLFLREFRAESRE